jgi:hypothetical protein
MASVTSRRFTFRQGMPPRSRPAVYYHNGACSAGNRKTPSLKWQMAPRPSHGFSCRVCDACGIHTRYKARPLECWMRPRVPRTTCPVAMCAYPTLWWYRTKFTSSDRVTGGFRLWYIIWYCPPNAMWLYRMLCVRANGRSTTLLRYQCIRLWRYMEFRQKGAFR